MSPKPRETKEKELVFHCEMHCPKCGSPHVDSQEFAYTPHHEHECENCNFRWRVEPYCFGVGQDHENVFERTARCIGCGATVHPELQGVEKGYLVYGFECAGCERLISYRVQVVRG